MFQKIFVINYLLLALGIRTSVSQLKPEIDSTINNLVHNQGYKVGLWGELGAVKKFGTGIQSLILIPGLGFDNSVFDDFMEANKSRYRMYAVTLAGYGGTSAPPMPPEKTSYAEQTWNRNAIDGIIKLIVKENMEKPIIVGHFVQGAQLAIRLAVDYPEKIGGVIILGGPAKYISVMGGRTRDFPLDTLKMFTDNFTAPRWFKHMKKSFFDENNFLPEIYSLDSSKGATLWKQSSNVPMPVIVRYICEYFASDLKVEVYKIKCPVLVLRSTFSAQILQNPINNYIQPQFMDSWNDVTSKNKLIAIKDIQNASTFVWKDQPEQTYETIHIFIGSIK